MDLVAHLQFLPKDSMIATPGRVHLSRASIVETGQNVPTVVDAFRHSRNHRATRTSPQLNPFRRYHSAPSVPISRPEFSTATRYGDHSISQPPRGTTEELRPTAGPRNPIFHRPPYPIHENLMNDITVRLFAR
ncbi:hypothetical protein [Couchioplanes caeruleus]|uniref:hypothetical protein n=1 Tax=Couchioplanes caeruleus TaxID=56438 RepID=UPI0011605F7C|nr:hypothetical protein [Couchioplanes caeruleus]